MFRPNTCWEIGYLVRHMKRLAVKLLVSLILLFLLASDALAATPKKVYKADLPVDDIINVQASYEAFEPIIVSCICDPAPSTDLRLFWSFSPKIKVKEGKNNEQHIWAPEGDHAIELTIVQQSYSQLTVIVPDPSAPTDQTKYKTQTIKIAGELTINHYKKGFRVGKAPQPPPDPTPAGPRTVTILHETGVMTPEWADQIKLLHNKIDSKHNLLILDVDSKGSDGKLLPQIQDYKRFFQTATPTYPAVLIIDTATRKVLNTKENISTADEVLSFLKAYGG